MDLPLHVPTPDVVIVRVSGPVNGCQPPLTMTT
jgi:hypothetical protein